MVVGIATNLEAMAADMRRQWADGPDAFAATIAAAGPDGARYRGPEEATLDLFKSLYTAVELVDDHMENGSAHVWSPVNNEHPDSRPLLETLMTTEPYHLL